MRLTKDELRARLIPWLGTRDRAFRVDDIFGPGKLIRLTESDYQELKSLLIEMERESLVHQRGGVGWWWAGSKPEEVIHANCASMEVQIPNVTSVRVVIAEIGDDSFEEDMNLALKEAAEEGSHLIGMQFGPMDNDGWYDIILCFGTKA